jgi:hypothetical protein
VAKRHTYWEVARPISSDRGNLFIYSKIVTISQEYPIVNIYIYVTFNDINYQRRVL